MIVHESDAMRELIEYVRTGADLDDLARLYSLLFTDESVVVRGRSGKVASEPYADGVLASEHRTRS